MQQKTNQTFLIILFFSTGLILIGQATRQLSTLPVTSEFSSENIRSHFISDARRLLLNQKLNLNTATAQDLDYLPRISLKKAQKIIKFREEIKSFKNLNQLTQIKGIGPKTVKKLEKYLSIHSS